MGFTLTHEHIITGSAGFRYTYPEMVNRQRVEEVAVDLLIQARKEGVTTLVDCTPMDLDRDVTLIQAVSKASGVNIICATGSHLYIPHALLPDHVRVDGPHSRRPCRRPVGPRD